MQTKRHKNDGTHDTYSELIEFVMNRTPRSKLRRRPSFDRIACLARPEDGRVASRARRLVGSIQIDAAQTGAMIALKMPTQSE